MALAQWTNAQVIAQLDSGYKWSGSTITYSFPTSTSGIYAGGGERSSFQPLNSSQQAAAQLALQLWDDLIAPDMQRTYSQPSYSSANIEYGLTTTGIGYAHAYYPWVGSVWFNPTYNAGTNSLTSPTIGRHGFVAYIHETGHALGLDHMGDYDGSGAWTPSSYQDSTVYTVMSYFGPSMGSGSAYGEGQVAWADWIGSDGVRYSPQTPMLNDVLAIQTMYGAETSTRLGDTVYGFNSNINGTTASIFNFALNRQPIITLFDSGGVDTLDLSGWSSSCTIDLAPGSFSSANWMTNNIAIAYSCHIENAVGGAGADTISGNALANRLVGGAGNDVIYALSGNDIIVGGHGNDTIDGGDGIDYVYLDETWDTVSCVYNSVSGYWEANSSIYGFDRYKAVEFVVDKNNVTRQLSLSALAPAPVAYAGTMSIAAVATSVLEGAAGTATAYRFSVTLSAASTETESASWTLVLGAGGNSASAADFTGATSGTATFAAGSTQAYIDLFVAGDAAFEADETFTVALSNPSSGVSFAAASATGVIRNDDAQPQNLIGNAYDNQLTGSEANDFLYGNGGNDTIYGNGGNDYIDGGAGYDTMYGGTGDDTYVVDNTYDVVFEAAGGGTDTVQTSLSRYALGSNVENLVGTTPYGLLANGNSLANAITGGNGSDTINGGLGSDVLYGGGGANTFVFDTALGLSNIDSLKDFDPAVDRIHLENAIFRAFWWAGSLSPGAFNTGSAASQSDDRIIYDPSNGKLYYDADGSGYSAPVQFAVLDPGLQLSASNFIVI